MSAKLEMKTVDTIGLAIAVDYGLNKWECSG